MSQKSDKRIRKHMKKELKGSVRIEARWRFPFMFIPRLIPYRKRMKLFSIFKFKCPSWAVIKKDKGWFEIKKFPNFQLRFKFRFIREISVSGRTVEVQKG